jgi:hypothetical protein
MNAVVDGVGRHDRAVRSTYESSGHVRLLGAQNDVFSAPPSSVLIYRALNF